MAGESNGLGADAPRRGRPPGTDESPESLIRKELIAHLKLYRRLREIVQKKLDDLGDAISPDDLQKYMDLLRKGLVDMARPIVAPAKAESAKAVEEEDPEKILASLLEGKK